MTSTNAQRDARSRGAATRAALVRSAMELIPQVGWGSVTTRGIAAQAGVRPGLVHYHFASIEALLVAAATDVSRGIVAEAAATLGAADDVPTGIAALVTSVTAVAPDDPAVLLLIEAALASTRIPALRQALAATLADLRDVVADWLAERGHPGDVAAIAAVIVAALDGGAVHRAVDPTLAAEPLRLGLRALVDVPPGRGTEGT